MGSSGSAHRVSIEKVEDDAFDVVHVSDDLVRKLRGLPPLSARIGSGAISPSAEASKAVLDLKKALDEEVTLTNRLRKDLVASHKDNVALRNQLSSIQDRQDALRRSPAATTTEGMSLQRQLDEMYRQKLAELNARQEALQRETAEAFKIAVEATESRFVRQNVDHGCADLESRLLACYLEHPRETLKCGSLARQYCQCVQEYRADLLARQS